MSDLTPSDSRQVAVFDDRPFFEKALIYGVRERILEPQRLAALLDDAAKGMVQIAEYFGTQYLRPNIEEARTRIVNLVSLYLEEGCGGDLAKAARSLRDNTFLSHSRGGSEMLKRLWAMPEDGSYGMLVRQSQKQFLAEWSLRTPADYRQLLEQRQGYQLTVSAALWFAEVLGVPASTISTVSVESIIRTALLVNLAGQAAASVPNAAEFAATLAVIRKKGVPSKGRKRIREVFQSLPDAYHAVAEGELKKLEAEDLPKILDASLPIEELMRELEPLYFLRDFGPEDAGQLDAMISKDWHRITRGKTDDSSLLTVFVCLAADTPPRPVLTRTAARTLIRKLRADGFQRPPVLVFIRGFAPYAMQADLETLWNEFFPEAEAYLLDASDTTLTQALAFLKENCVVV